jgi:hypothetical protein
VNILDNYEIIIDNVKTDDVKIKKVPSHIRKLKEK